VIFNKGFIDCPATALGKDYEYFYLVAREI